MDEKRLVWTVAIVLLLLAPFGLLVGAPWWGVLVVVVFEFSMAMLIAYWIKAERL